MRASLMRGRLRRESPDRITGCSSCARHRSAPTRRPSTRPDSEQSTTLLGEWYATALLWKPQVALLVNETTLLPALMPLAPAATLSTRIAPAEDATSDSARQQPHAHELSGLLDSRFGDVS